MRIHLTPKKGSRRFAGAAVAVSALAMMLGLGLIPAASAQTVAQTGPAAVAAPSSSTCHWLPTPSRVWVTDSAARVFLIWDPSYNRPGSTGVAYKITGQFPHSTTLSFTTYNNLVDINGPRYALNDTAISPNPGSVNPFISGNRVEVTPRNYTVYLWPDSIPVPAGLKNVVLYPTKPGNAGGTARWSAAMRFYKMQPGYSALAEQPKITAVSAANPSKAVRCPITVAGAIASQVAGFFAHKAVYGPIAAPPEPTTGNKIYFTKIPAAFFVGLDGYPGPVTQGCASYLVATVPLNRISVTTMHAVPQFFNNDLVTPASVMRNYPIRYQSLTDSYFTPNGVLYRSLFTNTDNAVYTSSNEWVTVWLPSEPRLTPSQDALVRAVAKALHYNVIQLPPKATGPIARNIPDGVITLRQKGISSSFPYSNLNVACWSENHNYKTYPDQTSPAFFAKYASSPSNNGPYYIDGFKLPFAQFVAKFSAK